MFDSNDPKTKINVPTKLNSIIFNSFYQAVKLKLKKDKL